MSAKDAGMFRFSAARAAFTGVLLLCGTAPADAAFAPQLYPPAPFPLVTNEAETTTILANGVSYAHYNLLTTAGPIAINAVLADARETTTQFRTVLANDHLVSPGETVSSMAYRTGAIAGINGDYFARGGTNEPLNIVINDGILYRTPGKRVALAIHTSGAISIGSFSWDGTAQWQNASVPVTAIDQWPPDGGASLILPTYGAPSPRVGVTFASLSQISTTPDGTTYRVTAETDNGAPRNTLGLAMGPAAMAVAPPPEVGETMVLTSNLAPASSDISTAIGGGPLLLSNGDYMPLVNLPHNDERPSTRLPLSGAAKTEDGSLLLLEVDGRQPKLSVGLTRPEFAALMSAFGATDGMCFDSGGSSTLVAQLPGERFAMLRNHPSDGHERRVADGLFVYSSAPAPAPLPSRAIYRQQNMNMAPATLPTGKAEPQPLGENPDL